MPKDGYNAECESRAAAILREEIPTPGDAVARARPHRPAGARERDAAQRRADGPGAADYQRVRRGLAAPLYLIQNEVDQIFQNLTRDAAIAEARPIAEQRAVSGGADGTTLQVVEVEDLPRAYLPGNSLRVRVRVGGDIGDRGGLASTPTASSINAFDHSPSGTGFGDPS